jgi:hypothetical protein
MPAYYDRNPGRPDTFLATPRTAGNVLTSTGTGWASASPGHGLVLLQTVTAANSSTVDIDRSIDSTYSEYLLSFSGVNMAGNDQLYLRMLIDGTYQTSGYVYTGFYNTAGNAGAPNSNNSASANFIPVSVGVIAQTQGAANGQIWFSNPSNTTIYKQVRLTCSFRDSSGYMAYNTINANNTNSTGALTGFRFYTSSTNITAGNFRLYGIKSS